MKFRQCILIAVAGFSLAGCDLVAFPGATPKKDASEHTLPPPPAIPDAAQTPASSESDASSEAGTPTTTAPSTNANTPAPSAETPDSIGSLIEINAARCASTTEETMTLAQITGARQASANVTAQAVNGTEITSEAFPGIVKMEPRRQLSSGGISSGHCSATRISANWFVTASHCLDDTYDEIRLIATEANLKDPRAVTVQATASICHGAYGGRAGLYSNDVALVGVSDATAALLTDVPIARYGATDKAFSPVNYPSARMAGWGLTGFDGQLSNTLLSAELSVVTSGPAAITVASRADAGPCIGDSGGPLLVDEDDGMPRIVGVLSVVEQNRTTGEFCKGAYNARYTNLAGYQDWIEGVIKACEASPELCRR